DYHLYLVPRLVRDRVPDALLTHFVHIPWPQPDYWHVLPKAMRSAIHDGLLANDVIGFHANRWRVNFLRSASDLVGADSNFVESAEAHRGVGMLALLDPSRQDIPEYSEYLGAIQREARRVNDRFQQNGWMPIEVVIEDNFTAAIAAYKQFDVLFVNAIFDGLNLVSK